MNKAIFLDRDGVICKEVSYISHISQLQFEHRAKEAISIFSSLNYKSIIISNQSGVGRGIIELEELLKIHNYIMEEIRVDEIYYCPHLPDENCICRKPNIGMFEQAIRDHDIDIGNSYMVGDRSTDILAGKNAGLKTVSVKTGYGEVGTVPDFIFENLYEFAQYLELYSSN